VSFRIIRHLWVRGALAVADSDDLGHLDRHQLPLLRRPLVAVQRGDDAGHRCHCRTSVVDRPSATVTSCGWASAWSNSTLSQLGPPAGGPFLYLARDPLVAVAERHQRHDHANENRQPQHRSRAASNHAVIVNAYCSHSSFKVRRQITPFASASAAPGAA
jgi:hypothetical protein